MQVHPDERALSGSDVHRPQAKERIFAKYSNKTASHPFEEILALHLQSLLPNPHPQPSISLPRLSRAVKLLALTAIATAINLISVPSLSGANPAALASHLDASVTLLDAYNAPLAEIECLHCGHLLLRFSLHLLAGEDHSLPLMPDRIRRAHKVIVEWETLSRQDVRGLAGDLTRRLAPGEPSCGKMSTVRRALYVVEAMAGLVMAIVVVVLSGREEGAPAGVKISSDFPWGETLKEMEADVSDRLRAGFPGEVEAVEVVVGVIDGEDDGEKAVRLGSTVEELEGVSGGVNGGIGSTVGRCQWVVLRDDAYDGC